MIIAMGLLSYGYESWSSAYTAATLLLLLTPFVLWRVRLWYRLRHIPGPGLVGWTIVWQLRGVMQDDWHKQLARLAEEHGMPMPNTVSIYPIF